jgi:uncharacterized membrane protein YgdD (TMEM256/DUF423 family)
MSVYAFAFYGAILAGLAVAMGAFGAHALKDVFGTYEVIIWKKAVFYETFHALALLVLPALKDIVPQRKLFVSGYLFLAGIILFSGSLYILALTGIRLLGILTPMGGTAFLLGWTWLAVALYQPAFKA